VGGEGVTEKIWVTYMEAKSPPASIKPFPTAVSLTKERLGYNDYMSLYRSVGEPLGWDTRFMMTPEALTDLLQSENSVLYVLRENAAAIGMCEYERQANGNLEVKHFGLVPEVQGRGLGLALLTQSLNNEWQPMTKRVWLHTDECDSLAAQPTYEKAGFTVFDRRLDDPEFL
jgi:ribosomal protein S18 acetylase RimI-like enzyme